MINGVNNLLPMGNSTGAGVAPGVGGAGSAGASSFADALKNSINEVAKLQQDASTAVDAVATGKTDNMSGVMTAVEKSDLAFKTLLAIRQKLMDAYEEIKGISV